MAPPSATAIDGNTPSTDMVHYKTAFKTSEENNSAKSLNKEPLKLSGVLDQFKSFDLTPVIGREFQDVDLTEWLKAPNSDELIRDLAITGLYIIIYYKNQISF